MAGPARDDELAACVADDPRVDPERRAGGRPEIADYPARIVRDAEGLSLLVENILSFNCIDKGRWVPRLQSVSPSAIWDEIHDELVAVTSAAVELEDAGLEEHELEADPELFRLLVANLARNGALYNDRDPVRLRFEASAGPSRTVSSALRPGP